MAGGGQRRGAVNEGVMADYSHSGQPTTAGDKLQMKKSSNRTGFMVHGMTSEPWHDTYYFRCTSLH